MFLTTKRKRTNSPKITIEDKTPPKSLNILNIEPISTIHLHTNIINSLLLLNDHTITSCSNDQTISIFDPFNPSHSSTITNRHTNNIYSLCQLSDDTIVSCSLDPSALVPIPSPLRMITGYSMSSLFLITESLHVPLTSL